MGIGCFSKNKKPMENPEPPGAQSPDTCLQGSNCQDSPPNTEESLGAPMGNETPEGDITLETFQRLSERLTKVHQNKLHQSKKLVLMVDLDNTLIHATEEPCECSPHENLFKMTMENSNPYHIRIRPYYKEFLEKMSQLYELNIFTFASRPYAKIIADYLDPTKTLFADRIISRDDCFFPSSKMENVRFFSPCGESMICMIDDRQDVWNYAPALIEVRPYFYFKDKDSSDNNQEDNDDYLPYLEKVLKRIHTEYYSRYEAYQRKEIAEVPDLSKIIPELRRKTLEGTTIVFSGLVPQGSTLPIIAEYHCAQGLGAKVEKNVVLRSANSNCTTHLIATKTRTKKAFIARQDKDIHIVTPSWLWSCWYHWEREEEFLFSLNDDIPEDMIRRKYVLKPKKTQLEVTDLDTATVKQIGWIFNERKDLFDSLNLSADPLHQKQNYTSECNNNCQQPGHLTRQQKRYWIEDEMSKPMDSVDIERPAKRPRLEEPIGGGSSQPQGWGNDQAQGTADQPHQGIEERRTKQQQWSRNQKRRWRKKHQAQANRGQPPLDSWMQNAGQVRHYPYSRPEPYLAPFSTSGEPVRPIIKCRPVERPPVMNRPYPEPVLIRPIPQHHRIIHPRQQRAPAAVGGITFNHNGRGQGFTQPRQFRQPLLNPENRAATPFPVNQRQHPDSSW